MSDFQKSSWSKDWSADFKRNVKNSGPSCVSLRSDSSKALGVSFREAPEDLRNAENSGPSCVSLKSDCSKGLGVSFREAPEDQRVEQSSKQPTQDPQAQLDFILLQPSERLRRHLQQRFSSVFEGVVKARSPTPLNQIFTELYITEGGAAGVNQEHEVINIENFSMKPAEATIACEDMFKGTPDSQGPIRTVLTKGVAGIGKTVLTQKFSLDWAEDRANQDLQLLFLFTFRELNVLRDTQLSLVGLLHHFFSPSKGFCSFENLQVLFIFDGLDECRLPLDFSQTRVLTNPTETASVHVLLVNLIRGRLLPSARLWITTRPAAANQIPAECVSLVTEVRGFTDPQKEQYFRKRFRDGQQAIDIISHIKTSRSLHIMCHLPIFCWILATVLENVIREMPEVLPKTLTNLYIHFLMVQMKQKNVKYKKELETGLAWTLETREMVQSLGKLAFEQLQKGNLIFYESDLSECGLDAAAASVYSGVFTQIFREEPGLYQDKVYCFIHLSVQEFLAALHVHQTFFSSGVDLLSSPHSSESCDSEADFYHSAVDQALQSPNGHLDLFLRFLLGLSLSTNQRLLQGLLTQTGSTPQTNQNTVEYIKEQLNRGVSAERSMNLFHCLYELNDRSLVEEVQSFMRRGWLCEIPLSHADWSAVAFLLLSSDSDLDEFDLRKYGCSERALRQLLLVVKTSTTSILSSCNLTEQSCGPLASVLSSSSLTHLDLSNNDLQNLGVELLCSGLKSAPCRLETLRLSGCLVTERGGAALASALSSTSSHLRELDLSYNHPGPSAKLLTALQDQRPLSVRLNPAGEQWMVPGLRKYLCDVSLDPNTAHRSLLVSADRLTATHEEEKEQEDQCPEHEDRFLLWPQVLSSSGLRGRCYWEVQWRGWVDVAVTYRPRGDPEERRFGESHQSWSLRIKDRGFYACHENTETLAMSHSSDEMDVSSDKVGGASGGVGVYLDSEAGSLSFYRVFSDGGLFHLHTFSCTFTEPLCPGFGLSSPGSSVSLRN